MMQSTLDQKQVLDAYFLEHRSHILDIAAFLDRFDRAQPLAGAKEDFRRKAVVAALAILADDQPERTRRILDVLSDPTLEPLASAAGLKGAYGAWPGKMAKT